MIPLTAKPSDLTDVKTKNIQVNTMVFTLPSVEVGSILEYRLQIRYDDNMVSSPTGRSSSLISSTRRTTSSSPHRSWRTSPTLAAMRPTS